VGKIEGNPCVEGSKVIAFITEDNIVPMKLSEYYTVGQVAEFFGTSDIFVKHSIRIERIKADYFGHSNKVVIHKSQIKLLKARRKPVMAKINRPPLKTGEYYDIEQASLKLKISRYILIDSIRTGVINAGVLGKNRVVIHEKQIQRLKTYRSDHKLGSKQKAQIELMAMGFKYSRNPPPGAPRGNARHPSPFRRGWSKNGVYYGLTAVEAHREWQRRLK